MNYAAENHLGDIFILGGLGGRLDQMLSNVHLLAHPRLVDRLVKLVEAQQSAWLIRERTSISGRPGDTVSLIPLGGDARVGATSGLRWSLSNEVLEFGKARGTSNVMIENQAVVTVRSGILLCVHSARGWER